MRFAVVLVWIVCALGVSGCNDNNESPTSPTPNNLVVSYSVVGASDAVGFGSSAPCLPFEDCNGNGYAQIVKRRFQSDGATITLTNRGLPGAVLSPAMLALARDIGRNDIPGTFLEQVVPFIPSDSTHVSIFAGGNDANVIAQNIRAGRGAGDIRAFIDQHVGQFGSDLVDMVSRLRARAPNARLVAMNLPNLAAAPYVASLSTTERSILQRIVVGMTDRINALAAQNVIVVDLMCEPRIYSPSNYSPDGFHPSDAGYLVMADLLYPALRNGSAPTPSSSCAQRTLLPAF
jgi:lysophospholipase L1-like esterase